MEKTDDYVSYIIYHSNKNMSQKRRR